MSIRILVVVSIALAPILVSCGGDEPETVTFLGGAFRVFKPGGWSMRTDLNDEATVQMGSDGTEAYCTIFTEAKVDFDAGVTVEDYGRLTRNPLLGSLTAATATGPEILTLCGMPAVRYVLLGTIEDIRIKYWHVAMQTKDHFHQVVLWSLPSRFDDNRADFEAVLASIAPNPGS